MPERNIAIVVFYGREGNILVQERGNASKVGEKYGFWGGRIEKNETPGQAIKRELKEELEFSPRDLKFWGEYSFVVAEEGSYCGWQINCSIFISSITPELERAEVHEGDGMMKMTIDEAIQGKGFSIGSTDFLKRLKKDLYGQS